MSTYTEDAAAQTENPIVTYLSIEARLQQLQTAQQRLCVAGSLLMCGSAAAAPAAAGAVRRTLRGSTERVCCLH